MIKGTVGAHKFAKKIKKAREKREAEPEKQLDSTTQETVAPQDGEPSETSTSHSSIENSVGDQDSSTSGESSSHSVESPAMSEKKPTPRKSVAPSVFDQMDDD